MVGKLASSLCTSICGPLRPAVRSTLAGLSGRAPGEAAAAEGAPRTREAIIAHENKVIRQPLVNRLIHWSIALSTGALFFSGFGQMPLYKRYMVADLPGMAWTANFATTLALHYFAAAVLIAAVTFHIVHHGLRRELGCVPRRGDLRESAQIIRAMLVGGKEPPSEKYLAEQRIAYAVIGSSLLALILSGMVKVAKNLQVVTLDPTVIAVSTHLHNLAMVVLLLAVAGHLAAFAIPANRKLIPGMLHGKVDLHYAAHRHPLWYRKLSGDNRQSL